MNCHFDKYTSVTFLFLMLFKSQLNYFNNQLKDKEIAMKDIPILMELNGRGFVHQKDIAKDLKMDNGLLTRNLRTLEDKQLIERVEDDKNRRQNKIRLTHDGTNLIRKINEGILQRENEILKNSNSSREEIYPFLITLLEKSIEFMKIIQMMKYNGGYI
ncbi:MarR family winged helix-turn-helix transcriptional regulator [Methanosphaera sp. WGK6]|uniref:MarR family winged helix-turn-helix transcriptional regulator n=1 Tax=Methanosphaera sp. WGK6 TaxID=1561964 RepID=UPI00084C056F|nr:MarR family transcriptional regulator [Methanosphaera sp. WGK6]